MNSMRVSKPLTAVVYASVWCCVCVCIELVAVTHFAERVSNQVKLIPS